MFVEHAAAAREGVAAAFGDDVQEDAGRLDLRAVSGGRNLHFLETVERVVGERRAHRRRVGHIHAVQVVLVLRPGGAGGGEERLLPALLPAHIHLVHQHGGRLFEHRPDVPPVRQVVEHRPIHRLPHPGPPDVQRPPRPRRDDALRHPGERKPQHHLRHRPRLHQHLDRRPLREPRMRRRHRVAPRPQPREPEPPVRPGRLRPGEPPPGLHQRDPRPGQHRPGRVLDHAADPPGRLRERRRGRGRHEDCGPQRRASPTPKRCPDSHHSAGQCLVAHAAIVVIRPYFGKIVRFTHSPAPPDAPTRAVRDNPSPLPAPCRQIPA